MNTIMNATINKAEPEDNDKSDEQIKTKKTYRESFDLNKEEIKANKLEITSEDSRMNIKLEDKFGESIPSGVIIKGENSGGDVNYYLCHISHPKREEFAPYTAECEDIIEALGMTFAEGTVFKALWRSCAERELGLKKEGGDGIRDAEKMVYSSNRVLVARKLQLPMIIGPITSENTEKEVDTSNAPGWIEWNGGDCPVKDNTLIEYKTRNNWIFKETTPQGLIWKHGGGTMRAAYEIIGYRVLEEKEE